MLPAWRCHTATGEAVLSRLESLALARALPRAHDPRNPAALLPKNSLPAPSNWEPEGLHCMHCRLGYHPLSGDSGPVTLRAPGTN